MFQATRRRLALWYTAVTAVLLLLFASGFYLYVRTTLVERVDDTLNHVVEIVERSLVIEPDAAGDHIFATLDTDGLPLRVNVEASFRDNARTVEDDHIDLEWFGPGGQLLWSTFSDVNPVPLHVNPAGETVRVGQETFFRQITERVQADALSRAEKLDREIESRRGEKMFERYGFKVMNRAEITKYKSFYPESVYLSTVIKNLETAEPLTVSNR